jgi:hypothetical protein
VLLTILCRQPPYFYQHNCKLKKTEAKTDKKAGKKTDKKLSKKATSASRHTGDGLDGASVGARDLGAAFDDAAGDGEMLSKMEALEEKLLKMEADRISREKEAKKDKKEFIAVIQNTCFDLLFTGAE